MNNKPLLSICTLMAIGTLMAVLLARSGRAAPPATAADLHTYETRYYTLQTDLAPEPARAIIQHITLMAEEYNRRTSGMGKRVDRRLPVYVVQNPLTYHALGGEPGTAGLFTGDKLMAVIDDPLSGETWHVIQHEGFHQFAAAAIGRELPIWANEGLAEYFGEGVFTGDAFYTGLIPPKRLRDVQHAIREHEFRPLRDIMQMSLETWNSTIDLAHEKAGHNYDEAWAMVQFLAHGDDGKYQQAFTNFLAAVARRQRWERAWVDNFGNDLDAFQERFDAYWLGLPEGPTAQLETEALVSTITSFYARAFSQRQYFDTFEDFVAAAEQLKADEEDWLPAELLSQALERTARAGTWSLRRGGQQAVLCEGKDRTLFEGRFQIANGRVRSINVLVKPAKKKS
jgi:hypothetical protein